MDTVYPLSAGLRFDHYNMGSHKNLLVTVITTLDITVIIDMCTGSNL